MVDQIAILIDPRDLTGDKIFSRYKKHETQFVFPATIRVIITKSNYIIVTEINNSKSGII